MKKFGMAVGLLLVAAMTGGLTVWGLTVLYPKQQVTQAQTQRDTPQQPDNTDEPAAQQKEIVSLTAEAKFTPKTAATIDPSFMNGEPTVNATGEWKKLQSADGSLKIVIGNTDGALITKAHNSTELRTREAAQSMGRVILGEYKKMNPGGIEIEFKEAVMVEVADTEQTIELQEVHYIYTAADGKQYRDIALVRHGAARNLFVIATKQVKDWTDDERAAFIRSVKVVKYAE